MLATSTLLDWYRRRARSRRRRAEFERRLKRADFVLVSLGKSGRTWLIVMVGHVLHRRFGAPTDRLLKSDAFYDGLGDEVPRFVLSHIEPGNPLLDEFKRPLPQFSSKKVILLVRDPRDVAVSSFHHYRHRASQDANGRVGETVARHLTDDDARQVRKLIKRTNHWVTALKSVREVHTLRYEDLRADPHAQLANLLDFCAIPYDRADLDAAVAFASFDNMKSLEAGNHFKEKALRPADPCKADAFKVRRGKVGGYRDDLTSEQCARLDTIVREELAPELGYG